MSYCPQHKGYATVIIDTWPARCGTCCKNAGGPGTPDGRCCPNLWDERSNEELARPAYDNQTFREVLAEESMILFEGKTYVDSRAWDVAIQQAAKTLSPGEVMRMDGTRMKKPASLEFKAVGASKDTFGGYKTLKIKEQP